MKYRFVAILLLISICLCLCLSACKEEASAPQKGAPDLSTEEEELPPLTGGTKAMIFVPGIMGSQLYNEETGQFLWDFFTVENVHDCTVSDNLFEAAKAEYKKNPLGLIKTLTGIVMQSEGNILSQLLSDEDGNLLYPTTKGYPDSEDRRDLGGFASYEGIITALRERYGSKYEVKFFDYNFLQDVRLSAVELQNYIEENNFTEVVLISHSMGGLVTSAYLTKAQNRRRIAKNVVITSPLYGSFNALDALESHDYFDEYADMLKEIAGMITFANVGKNLSDRVDDLKNGAFSQLVQNTTTVYQLLPSAELLTYYADSITNEGVPVSPSELLNLYRSREWAKKADGSYRQTIDKYADLREDLYVVKNGEKVFSTELVDSYYIAGVGSRTPLYAQYVNGQLYFRYTRDGDGLVTLYSATLGKEPDNEHVFAVQGGHDIGNDLNKEAERILFSILDEKITDIVFE